MRGASRVTVALWIAAFAGVLGAQAQSEDVEFGTVQGHVFEKAAGVLLPLEGAVVTLRGMGMMQKFETGKDGAYIFEEVRPGDYCLSAHCDGFLPQWTMVRVPPGGLVEHDFILEPFEYGVVKGQVFGETPTGPVPLEGAVVKLYGMWTMQKYVTGKDGAYIFDQVRPGKYHLTAFADGYVPERVMVEVKPGAPPVVHDFTLKPFEFGVVKGHVFEAASVPLEGAVVRLYGMWTMQKYVTGKDGAYVFDQVRPGEYHLTACAQGYVPQWVKIEVGPGQTVEHDFILEKLEFGSVEGVVEGETPAGPVPLEGALVRLCGMGHAKYCKTNEKGEYGFEKVRPGKYRLTAMAKGYAPETVEIEVEANQTVTHDFLLKPEVPPGAFVGRVLGEKGPGLIPIAGATVRLLDGTGNVVRYARTHWNGEFAMHRVPPGEYKAVATARGWLPDEAQIEIISGEVTKHEFVLKRQ